jgi:hypothetical protein
LTHIWTIVLDIDNVGLWFPELFGCLNLGGR